MAIKRFFDLGLALLLLPVLTPLFLLIALLVRYNLGSPVLFVQKRPGLNGKPFKLIKFRTMTLSREPSENLDPDELRQTKFGSFLRSTSLDELPEIWNIIRGEMSFVGPRPLLMEYLDLYTKEEAIRHSVLPGLTGWAQVNGRNTLSWNEKFRFDIWYVKNQSVVLDIKIILLTLKIVLSRRGVRSDGRATSSSLLDYRTKRK